MKQVSLGACASVVLSAVLMLSGCASIVSKTSRQITLNSTPQSNFVVTDENGSDVYSGTTPYTVSLKTGGGWFDGKDYTVRFKKQGYEDRIAQVKSSINGWFWGNILFGGVIGMLIVDPLTGAMWTLEPEAVNVSLPIREQHEELSLLWLEDVPDHLRRHLVPVG